MCIDICLWILFVQKGEQFSKGDAEGKVCPSRNAKCPRTNMGA